jgi:lipopolysaccharide cholinephosphotransferase
MKKYDNIYMILKVPCDTLITTFNKTKEQVVSLVNEGRFQGNILVGNQNSEKYVYKTTAKNGSPITIYGFTSKGVSQNRNQLLNFSTADYLTFCDDDMIMTDNYWTIVLSAFQKYPKANVIRFNVESLNPKRKIRLGKKNGRIGFLTLKSRGVVGCFYKRAWLFDNQLGFDETMGPGTAITSGEDTLFNHTLCKKTKQCFQVCKTIAQVKQDQSSWFSGYNEQYFINTGYTYQKMFGSFAGIYLFFHTWKHQNHFAGTPKKIINIGLKKGRNMCKSGAQDKHFFPLSEDDLAKLKEKEDELLEKFESYCGQKNLSYCAAYGTLLGAVRHKGFIPWDDDIDVTMPYKDYQLFIQGWNSADNSKSFYLETPLTADGSLHAFSKMMLKNTSFIESGTEFSHGPKGIFIDIFPLIHFPKNSLLRSFLVFKSKILLSRALQGMQRKTPLRKKVFSFILSRGCSPRTATIKLVKFYEKIDRRYQNSGIVIINSDTIVLKSQWFTTVDVCKFENHMVNIPHNFDDVLRAQYGDYTRLPPESERISHHFISYLSFDNEGRSL